VAAAMAAGVTRDHVRLNGAGVADDRGKFDETLVPKGARFTFEIAIDDPQDGEMDRVLGALGPIRLGGRTRRGFGVFGIVRVLVRRFDLRIEGDREDWARLPRALEAGVPEGVLKDRLSPESVRPPCVVTATIEIEPEDYWMFGGGVASLDEHVVGDKAHDMVPVTEPVIRWNSQTGQGTVGPDPSYVIPASGVKGALAHRTALHYRRLTEQWHPVPGGDPPEEGWSAATRPPELHVLFGSIRNREGGVPGRVFVGDVYPEESDSRPAGREGPRSGALAHVSIDRFTQGPVDGHLFTEAPLYGGGFRLEMAVDTRGEVDPNVKKAFRLALEDLVEGRLAIGAGGNRGHGFCRGKVKWDDEGKWIGGEA
ncbi:MAG: RAMP superfamily CRISPR-associated protein, partial [Myxococcota bacterium]|nr:RAMP superfamily CRISPR-associated protein [Myxococcota bacterium]